MGDQTPEARVRDSFDRQGLMRTLGATLEGVSSGAVEIHYATVFDGRTPTLCGVASTPKQASNEWRYVSCRACLVLGVRTSKDAAARLRAVETESSAAGE